MVGVPAWSAVKDVVHVVAEAGGQLSDIEIPQACDHLRLGQGAELDDRVHWASSVVEFLSQAAAAARVPTSLSWHSSARANASKRKTSDPDDPFS